MKTEQQLGDAMNDVEIKLSEARKAGHAAREAGLLTQQAALWREYGQQLKAKGREWETTELPAMRCEHEAAELRRKIMTAGRIG